LCPRLHISHRGCLAHTHLSYEVHQLPFYYMNKANKRYSRSVGSGGTAPRILNPGTRWRWAARFTLRPLYSWERAPNTHYTEGWVDHRACRNAMKRKNSCPYRKSKPDSSAGQLVA
jgi:hypothetical protein